MELYDKLKKFVDEAFVKAGDTHDLKHFERTVYWLLQLKADSDEALRAAAYAHDIERAFRDPGYNKITASDKGFVSEDHLQHHQDTGAAIVAKFLTEQGAPEKFIAKVQQLISRHEIGGSEEENLLKDADSLSYFENQVDMFIAKKVPEAGKEKVREKFQWMFNRITSVKAKELARPMYEQAIKKLE